MTNLQRLFVICFAIACFVLPSEAASLSDLVFNQQKAIGTALNELKGIRLDYLKNTITADEAVQRVAVIREKMGKARTELDNLLRDVRAQLNESINTPSFVAWNHLQYAIYHLINTTLSTDASAYFAVETTRYAPGTDKWRYAVKMSDIHSTLASLYFDMVFLRFDLYRADPPS